ncbi:hypothetical protein PBCV1_a433aR [Paramecium bursaria Chlorella virus 1]|uniref:Uncharacterized protein n=1 Tax=Paramecium bursaria Chlorella virus 1 TaxID=10506 RepID=F8TU36_PBCV1|nr:hypothetical protein PBCV1_a433aR [Paramecium bursaria Chlorella virus 1]AEI70097.1 hypothetical protein [Paramecium bursaria Chlorella virus 1]
MLKKRNERQKSDCVRSQKKGYGSYFENATKYWFSHHTRKRVYGI